MKTSLVSSCIGSVLVTMLLASVAAAAEGDPCFADTDCADGYQCDVGPSAQSGSSGESGGDSASASAARPDAASDEMSEDTAPAGSCERAPVVCQQDSDCAEHYVCSKYETSAAARVDCDPAGDCSEVDVETTVSEDGVCVGKLITCVESSECPTASGCIEGVCAFELQPCQEDSECADGSQCIKGSSGDSGDCSVSPCTPGEQCSTEPVCESSEGDEGTCLPKPIACTSDGDCEGDLDCYDIPNADAPAEYANVDFACWPPGLIGAVEGYVAVASDGELMESKSDDAGSSGEGVPAMVNVNLRQAETNSAAGDDTTDSTGDSSGSSGCAMSAAGLPLGGGMGAMMALALVATGAVRRRRH